MIQSGQGSATDALGFPAIPRVEVHCESKWDYLENSRRKTPKSDHLYRDGPAPKTEAKKSASKRANGSLDSDVEEIETDAQRSQTKTKGTGKKGPSAGSKAFIIYFSKLAHAQDSELVDFDFVESLLDGGASINSADRYGQTVFHEVARNWHPDVAFFLLQKGADINRCDKWGRTPLHSASAVDHAEMIEFLLQNGANINAKTTGEMQSPIHYAAKFDATKALKVLIDWQADVNDRDYKGRTPLFVAAETAREESTRYLLERGAPAGVFDQSGLSAVALLIEKLPKVAHEALQQFVTIDRAFRKEYYYLSYLESDPAEWKDLEAMKKHKKEMRKDGIKVKLCPTTPLKIAVRCKELEILMDPVMQKLISVKWNQFGKFASCFAAGFHFAYIMIWTWLAIFLPTDGNFYSPPSKFWWRIILEFLGCMMTLYFILKQIWEVKTQRKDEKTYQTWRVRELERDIEFCHPRWPDEQDYIESEIRRIRLQKTNYFKDAWNIMDWLTYIAVLTVIITRILAVFSKEKLASDLHPRAYALALIFMWLHFMKSCRPFKSLGPFITMLGHVLQDTLRFAFLFFEFFIPYVCAFWIVFGGKVKNADSEWVTFNDLIFSVWKVTLIADFEFGELLQVDSIMAQILVGSYFAVASVVCMNLYIALLSETFARVYQNAKANAALLQATTILQVEKALSKKRKNLAEKFIQKECCPMEVSQGSDPDGGDDNSYFNRMVHQISIRLDVFEDRLKESSKHSGDGPQVGRRSTLASPIHKNSPGFGTDQLLADIMIRNQQIEEIWLELQKIRETILNHFHLPKPSRSIGPTTRDGYQLKEPPRTRGRQSNLLVPQKGHKEDFMRKFIDKKTRRDGHFDVSLPSVAVNKRQRRKRRKSNNGRGYCSEGPPLSGSWEDVSQTEAESVF